MGFSVSGATVVLFLGIFISFGVAYTAANNGFEQVNDAYGDTTDDELTRQNTAVSVVETSVGNVGGQLHLNVTVNNTGSTALSVEDTDILIDGNYTSLTSEKMNTLVVEGNDATDLWLPGESLYFEVEVATRPSRVKVVTGPGVADSEVV